MQEIGEQIRNIRNYLFKFLGTLALVLQILDIVLWVRGYFHLSFVTSSYVWFSILSWKKEFTFPIPYYKEASQNCSCVGFLWRNCVVFGSRFIWIVRLVRLSARSFKVLFAPLETRFRFFYHDSVNIPSFETSRLHRSLKY